MVKAECNKALDASSTSQDSQLNQIIANVQQWLASEYDWPFLAARWDINIAPGSRYLPFPTTDDGGKTCAINFERAGALRLYIKWNNIWQDVYYGIDEQSEFNYIDSDLGQVLDPVQRWLFDDEGNFEIWPMNASGQLLRFTGQRVLTSLTSSSGPPVWNDTATCDLDDLLITYFAAAEYMAREEQLDVAKDLMSKAVNRLALVRATYPQRKMPPTIIGGGTTFDRRALRIVPLVVVGRT